MFSCVAVWRNGRVEVCPNEQGNRITPSYCAWTSDGQRLAGDAAKNQATSNPSNTVFDVKRLIGRKFSDPSVQKDSKLFPFKGNITIKHNSIGYFLFVCLDLVVQGSGDKPMISIDSAGEKKVLSPEEVSAMVSYKS